MFHTVPYYSQHKDDIEYDQFNQLGTQASLGCIRLLVCDVKWIYDNCPIGTRVVIYDNADDPGPMGKPGTIYTDPDGREQARLGPHRPGFRQTVGCSIPQRYSYPQRGSLERMERRPERWPLERLHQPH